MTTVSTAPDSVKFRQACGRFATGVAVVTACIGADRAGMTINSFASVSLDPPLVLWSLRNSARFRRIFEAAGSFAVSILASEQLPVARCFAAGGEDAFAGSEIVLSRRGLPLIAGALAHLECITYDRHAGGDHQIIMGAVTDLQVHDGEPLLFFRGRFSKGLPQVEGSDN